MRSRLETTMADAFGEGEELCGFAFNTGAGDEGARPLSPLDQTAPFKYVEGVPQRTPVDRKLLRQRAFGWEPVGRSQIAALYPIEEYFDNLQVTRQRPSRHAMTSFSRRGR